ncbi:MAG TPA: ABC transporter permease subunit [Candidatus Cloacimonadota bacterium]|jgi:ABC-type transport system involved in multi-copper enzyme maturation permease subunit|nr:ABC transporter permease subunit [Candidatus Cloacimonadales bacterium]HPY96142.1 ABC transporter permease subunit [Candidatus Cloacimonadota bacterium]HQB40756.1 ABC transporter permease subunit [Candidatus Cloacimonadota bacterium]
MNSVLFIKDLKLILKDLKFQMFFIILVILFILSAISSSVSYKNLSSDFQADYKAHVDMVNDGQSTSMMGMLTDYWVIVAKPADPSLLFSNYNTYPDKISTAISFYEPRFFNYGTEQGEVFSLNWYFILGILSGFIMLVISFEAISAEKRFGTLRLLSIYGVKRQDIMWHKYLSYMLLYLIIIIPPALVSMLLFFALTGTWSMIYMAKFALILLLSIPFASFFIVLGILISMSKNYRNSIVLIVFIWLLFVIIIPQSAYVIARQIRPLKTNTEYHQEGIEAFNNEFEKWGEQYNSSVYGNGSLEDGLRAKAVYAAGEKKSLVSQEELKDSKQQTRLIQKIASMSPFYQLEMISEIIFDKGYYLLQYQEETAKQTISQIKNLMIEQDSHDNTSLHLFYRWASADQYALNGMLFPFSKEKFNHPELLFVTNVETDKVGTKALSIILRLLPILLLNIITFMLAAVKLERLDIR